MAWFGDRIVTARFAAARRGVTAAVAAAALIGGPVGGPAAVAQGDPLDREKILRQVADQRTDLEVRDAVREAEQLARVSPTKAVEALKKVAVSVDVSAAISSAKRKELAEYVQARIAAVQGKLPPPAADPKTRQQHATARKVYEAGQAEAKDVRDGVAEVAKLYGDNKLPQAQAKVAELVKKFPTNPAVLALGGQGYVTDRVAEARLLAREQNDRYTYALLDVQRSALPAKTDMEFPKDWKEKSERRRRLEPKLLGPEEEAILRAMETVVKTGVTNAPFEETVQTLSNLIDKPIYLDTESLKDAGLDLKRPVSVPANVTARTALRAVLQAQGLTYVVKEKVIQVLTLEKAQTTLVTRAYYLGDLISLTGPQGGAATWGPFADAQQTMANAQLIMDSITQSVDPLVWAGKNHGPATILFNYPSLSIIVRAPAEVHATLGSKFGR